MKKNHVSGFENGIMLVLIPIILIGILAFSIYGLFLPEFTYTARRGATYCFEGVNKNIFFMALALFAASFLLAIYPRYLVKLGLIKQIAAKYVSYTLMLMLGSIIVVIITSSIASLECVHR